jgi:hypothetical protein
VNEFVKTKSVAAALGVSAETVRKRGEKERWLCKRTPPLRSARLPRPRVSSPAPLNAKKKPPSCARSLSGYEITAVCVKRTFSRAITRARLTPPSAASWGWSLKPPSTGGSRNSKRRRAI